MRNQPKQNEDQRQDAQTARLAKARKPFVEPTITSPVNVLEATTFFQVVDSGNTGD